MAVDYRGVVKHLDNLCQEKGYTNFPPLKAKYTVQFTPKLGGKKKKSGNSGGVGRVARRKKRATMVCHAVKKAG